MRAEPQAQAQAVPMRAEPQAVPVSRKPVKWNLHGFTRNRFTGDLQEITFTGRARGQASMSTYHTRSRLSSDLSI